MKFALRALLVLSVAAVVTQAGTAAPPLHTVPYSGFFWTPEKGLIGVGLCASTKYLCGTGAVELTTDGGRTYRIVLRTPSPITVESIGRGAAIAGAGKHAYRTLDGGRTWTPWHARADASFATPTIGLHVRMYQDKTGFRASLLRTSDGGRTWHRLSDLSKLDLCGWAAELDLVTPRLAWMVCVGQPGAGNEMKAVFRSRDGGRTWRMGAAAIAGTHSVERGGLGFLGYPAGISFAPNGFGLMLESRGTLYVTRDGGKTWRARARRFAEDDVDFALGGSAFANGTGFVLFRHAGTSYRAFVHAWATARLIETRDFGRTWHIVRRWRNH